MNKKNILVAILMMCLMVPALSWGEETELGKAVSDHNLEKVQELLKDPSIRNNQAEIDAAFSNFYPRVKAVKARDMKELMELLSDSSTDNNQAQTEGSLEKFYPKVNKDDEKIANLLLDAGVSQDVLDRKLWYATGSAGRGENEDTRAEATWKAKFLIEHGADVNKKSFDGDTPLIHAADNVYNAVGALEVLLGDERTDVNAQNDAGETALMKAVSYIDAYHVRGALALLDAPNIDINIRDNKGQTAFTRLIKAWDMERPAPQILPVVKRFLKKIDVTDEEVQKVLGFALEGSIRNNETEMIDILLESGLDINYVYTLKDGLKLTTFAGLASGGYNDILKKLLNKASQESIDLALIRAARNGYTDTVKLLLSAGANVNAQDQWGDTALMKAAAMGRLETVKTLLEVKDIDLFITSNDGRTALMHTKEKGHEEIVTLLEEAENKAKK